MDIIEAAAKYAGGAKVTKIALVIGEASGVAAESIELYFDIIAEDTPCAGAELTIETVRQKMKCLRCDATFERKPFSFECVCGGEGAPTEAGKEFYIKYIEVEE